jgi:hypothetical protein
MWAALDQSRPSKKREESSFLAQTLDEIESFRPNLPPRGGPEDADLVVHRASLDGEAVCAEYRAMDAVLIQVFALAFTDQVLTSKYEYFRMAACF